MTVTTTLRRNALKPIRAMLEAAALVRFNNDDGQDCTTGRMTVAEVMALAPRFKRVSVDTDTAGNFQAISISLGGSYHISAYASREVAQRLLTAQAFAKYFPA